MERATVIGAGPNGLAAALVLAHAGLRVDVFEAEAEPGGAARTLPLTLPGFLHDFGSAAHPLAAGSPYFRTLTLENNGLEWMHGEAPLAHPLDDGSAVVLERDIHAAERALGVDGRAWRALMQPVADHWAAFAEDLLAPPLRVPRHPLRMARFGWKALRSARALAFEHFRTGRTRALFAGLAAHSCLPLDQPLSAAIALVLGAAAHAVGWPVPRGGAGMITQAMVQQLQSLGGAVHTGCRIDAEELRELETDSALILCDTTPRALLALARGRLTPRYQQALERFQPGPGAFKIDYALSAPVPWRALACSRVLTVHVGGSFEEIAAAEAAVTRGQAAERPFVLVTQPSLVDSTRAPAGKHVLWAYCHVPNGSTVDMTERIETQIERFAPGFRDCILARRVFTPAALEAMDANLLGGDIGGGALTLRQFFLRPALGTYATSDAHLYLCSASTPPGGGVHGMCGYHAAQMALRRLVRQ